MNRLVFKTEIPETREILIQLPEDAPVGPAEIEISVRPGKVENRNTYAAFLESGVFGAWKDRPDIGDSVEFARKLRERVWKRER